MTSQAKHLSLENALDLMGNRMFSALNAYYIWKHLNKLINVNFAGKESAEKNVAIVNKYGYFFHQTLVSTYKSFVADLAVFFDAEKYPDSVSMGKILNLVKNETSEGEIVELRSQIAEIKKKHKITVGLLLELRNADVAHQAITQEKHRILYAEFESLFAGVQEILNLISQKNDRSYTAWNHLEKEITHQIEWLLDNLVRGEKARLIEIEKEFSSKEQ